jgi:hypothetical protein
MSAHPLRTSDFGTDPFLGIIELDSMINRNLNRNFQDMGRITWTRSDNPNTVPRNVVE